MENHVKQKIKNLFDKDKIDFIKSISNIWKFKNSEYFFIPFYFKKCDEENVYELLELGKLPIELVKELSERRGTELKIENEHLSFAEYLTGHDSDTIKQMFNDYIKNK
jgi:hypothetical protein